MSAQQAETTTVTATLHTDDYEHEVTFDAAPALAEMSDERLLALRDIGFRGDYEADEVAYAREGDVPEIAEALAHCDLMSSGSSHPVGFEVVVDANQAEA